MFFSPDIILSIFLFTFRNPLDIFERIPEEIEKKKHNRKFCLTYYYYLLFLLYFRIMIKNPEFDLSNFKHHEYFSINQNIDF